MKKQKKQYMKLLLIILFLTGIMCSCECVNNNTKIDFPTDDISGLKFDDKTSINNKKILNKLFYSLLEENNNILIDTLYSIEIKDSILIDKLSMDWYLLKIKKIDTISGTVNIYIGEESQYEDDPKLYEWGEIMNNRYIYYIKKKGKYLSISNNLTQGYEDLCIDRDSVKKSKLEYYIYEE